MLAQHQQTLKIPTQGKSFHPLTHQVQQVVGVSGIQTGLCTVFVRHTSASLIIQENADPDVLADLATFFAQLVPEDPHRYRHSMEGLDDMPSHIRSVLTKTSEQVPIANGRLVLGTWQGIYLWEHRQNKQYREIVVHVSGL
ncbi:MAG: secondary thiamine-phosphate synthase enzyme YjbQ [Merismopediaceae bacterium]|nr:secondary thiamine-phosphate synthase enzyme YjbQ [Merismopediaceae bacterium]